MKKILNEITFPDILVFAGLLLIFLGLWQYKIWLSCVITGTVIMILGLLESRRR